MWLSTSFLAVATIPYVIAGTCPTTPLRNFRFLAVDIIFLSLSFTFGILSLLLGVEVTTAMILLGTTFDTV